jgi:hypothetical protein
VYQNQIGQTDNCPPGTISRGDSDFIQGGGTGSQQIWTHWVSSTSADAVNHWGSTYLSTKNCAEYANFYPWSSGAHVADQIRTAPASTTGNLGIRYKARYPDVNTSYYYDMIHDYTASSGNGSWAFFQDNCVSNKPAPGTY